MKHMGNMTITKENALGFPAVNEFYGHLTVDGAHLTAPNLNKVRGWVTLVNGAQLDAPHLGVIEGWLTVKGGSITAPALTTLGRDLTVERPSKQTLVLPALKVVMSINVLRDSGVRLPELELVGANVTIAQGGVLDLPKTASVSGSITLRQESELTAPLLKHIGGFYDADAGVILYAPAFLNA